MLIAIATSGLPCNGNSLKTGSLGGSETALISIAAALAKRGHEVRVFCECPQPGVYDNVQYFPKEALLQTCSLSSVDVLIASRWFHFLLSPMPCGLRVLWLHDVLVNKDEWMAGQFQTDLVMPLSDYHIANYCDKLPDIKPLMWKTANGIDDALISQSIRPKVPGKLIYTSRPERGLHYLLKDILPEIVKRRPDAKLYYANYDTSSLDSPPQVKQVISICDQLARENPQNVVPMGHLHKQALYQQMSSAQLQLYPTDFPEIFCISAIEAQACGTPIITTDDFALRETVGPDSGILIPGTPSDPKYVKAFADKVCQLLDDQEALQRMSAAGPKFVKQSGYVWDDIAAAWETKFLDLLSNRWQSRKLDVIQQLEHSNDLATAEYVARREGLNDRAEELSQEIKNVQSVTTLNSDIREDYANATPRFQRMLELLRYKNVKTTRILDYSSNDLCYGLVLAKTYPTSEVVIRAVDDETAVRLRAYAEKSCLSNVRVIAPADKILVPGEKEFDLLFLGDVIDSVLDPIDYLKRVQTYVADDGCVLLTTRYGSESGTKKGDGSRLWNFEFGDFRSMFRGKTPFDASFQEEGLSVRNELQGHWSVLFKKSTGISSPSVEEKLNRTRPYESLAVCMIAKNEADWLRGCLKSVSTVADKIVVCDTGSSDQTIEIAKEFGAEIRQVAFDNFSQARNASIENISENWILWIDADERLAAPEKLRKYLHTGVYNGFGIRQNHLMLDIAKAFDVPVRLLRNLSYHRFTGVIHEHCERVDRKPFDDAIAPVLVIPDVDIVHYGYMNERVRRQKCSNRNMELLIRDVNESAPRGRMLTWVLVIRDYLNFVKWSIEKTNGRIAPGSREHELLNAAIATFRIKFGDGKNRYDPIARPMYQEALQFLGRNMLTYNDRKHPPIELGCVITAAMCGLEDKNVGMQTQWFLDYEELMLHLHSKGTELVTALGASKVDYPEVDTAIRSKEEMPDTVRLLSSGLRVIPSRLA